MVRIPLGKLGSVLQPQVSQPQCLHNLGPVGLQDACVALLGDRLPCDVLGKVPVDRAPLPRQQVGELPQGVGELLRISHRAKRPHTAERIHRAAAARTAGPAAAGRAGIAAGTIRRTEAEGRLSHLPGLSGRMEGSTTPAKLSRERCTVSNRVAQVRHERSTAGESPGRAPRRRRAKEAGAAGLGAGPAGLDSDGPDPAAEPGQADGGRLVVRPGPVVAITGAARGLGLALTTRLAESTVLGRVIAIDQHRGDVSGVTWRITDVRDPALASRLSDVDVIVHADLDLSPDADARTRRAFNVRGAQTVLTAAAAGGVSRVVLVTSAMVYGAHQDNPVPLPENSPLTADSDHSVVGDLLEIEHLAERSPRAHLGLEVVVARPAALVGDVVDTVITRHFEAPRLLAVKGCAARWQFCHVDDLASALELAVAA